MGGFKIFHTIEGEQAQSYSMLHSTFLLKIFFLIVVSRHQNYTDLKNELLSEAALNV